MVVLGQRSDPTFLWRLWTLLGRADRVVSNRLSTPVLYAAHLGADVGVYGDALRIDGEDDGQYERVRGLWPELHAEHADQAMAQSVANAELGIASMRAPQELAVLLGWHRPTVVPGIRYWSTSVVQRAVINLHRRSAAPVSVESGAPGGLSHLAWLRGATSYLPRPLPRVIPAAGAEVEPLHLG